MFLELQICSMSMTPRWENDISLVRWDQEFLRAGLKDRERCLCKTAIRKYKVWYHVKPQTLSILQNSSCCTLVIIELLPLLYSKWIIFITNFEQSLNRLLPSRRKDLRLLFLSNRALRFCAFTDEQVCNITEINASNSFSIVTNLIPNIFCKPFAFERNFLKIVS